MDTDEVLKIVKCNDDVLYHLGDDVVGRECFDHISPAEYAIAWTVMCEFVEREYDPYDGWEWEFYGRLNRDDLVVYRELFRFVDALVPDVAQDMYHNVYVSSFAINKLLDNYCGNDYRADANRALIHDVLELARRVKCKVDAFVMAADDVGFPEMTELRERLDKSRA